MDKLSDATIPAVKILIIIAWILSFKTWMFLLYKIYYETGDSDGPAAPAGADR